MASVSCGATSGATSSPLPYALAAARAVTILPRRPRRFAHALAACALTAVIAGGYHRAARDARALEREHRRSSGARV